MNIFKYIFSLTLDFPLRLFHHALVIINKICARKQYNGSAICTYTQVPASYAFLLPWHQARRRQEVFFEGVALLNGLETRALLRFPLARVHRSQPLTPPGSLHKPVVSILPVHQSCRQVCVRLPLSQEIVKTDSGHCDAGHLIGVQHNCGPENPPPVCQNSKRVFRNPACPR